MMIQLLPDQTTDYRAVENDSSAYVRSDWYSATQIGFHVSEFDEVHSRVVGSEYDVLQEPRDEPWGRTAGYLDPDGNIASITEARPINEALDP